MILCIVIVLIVSFAIDPDLLTKVISAVDEKLFNDFVLAKHLKVLIEEWKK